jgi:hypothetical protein
MAKVKSSGAKMRDVRNGGAGDQTFFKISLCVFIIEGL